MRYALRQILLHEVVTATQAAKILGISKQAIATRIRQSKTLDAVRVGQTLFVDVEDVKRVLIEEKQKKEAEVALMFGEFSNPIAAKSLVAIPGYDD